MRIQTSPTNEVVGNMNQQPEERIRSDPGAVTGGCVTCRSHKWRAVRYHGPTKRTWDGMKFDTKKEAEKRLREILGDVDRGEYVEPSKVTVGDFLDEWVEKVVKPQRSASTYRAYENAIRTHIKP